MQERLKNTVSQLITHIFSVNFRKTRDVAVFVRRNLPSYVQLIIAGKTIFTNHSIYFYTIQYQSRIFYIPLKYHAYMGIPLKARYSHVYTTQSTIFVCLNHRGWKWKCLSEIFGSVDNPSENMLAYYENLLFLRSYILYC
jgi:hypothetical protein